MVGRIQTRLFSDWSDTNQTANCSLIGRIQIKLFSDWSDTNKLFSDWPVIKLTFALIGRLLSNCSLIGQ